MAAIPLINLYQKGALVRVITDAFLDYTGMNVDPVTVTVKYRSPTGVLSSYTYGTNPQVSRVSTGVYYCDITANESGEWYYRWEGHGNIEAIGFNSFYVESERL